MTRKRQINKNEWLDVKAKTKLDYGEEHVNRIGQLKSKMVMGKKCTDKCRYKCHEKVKEVERIKIFNSYWGLRSHNRQ